MTIQSKTSLWLIFIITQVVILMITAFHHEWFLLTIAMLLVQVSLFHGLVKHKFVFANPSMVQGEETQKKEAQVKESQADNTTLADKALPQTRPTTENTPHSRDLPNDNNQQSQAPSSVLQPTAESKRERLAFHALEHIGQAVIVYESDQLRFANKSALMLFNVKDAESIQFDIHFPSKPLKIIQKALAEKQDVHSMSFNIVDAQSNIIGVELEGKHSESNYFLYIQSAQLNLPTSIKKDPARQNEQKKALLVDDSMTNQLLMKGLLNSQGWDVTCAEDGLQAIEKAAEHVFDVILMDLQMPNIDGILASQHIRDIKRHNGQESLKSVNQNTLIISMSSTLDDDMQTRINLAGINDFIKKPITRDNLCAKLDEYFDTEHHQNSSNNLTAYDSTDIPLEEASPTHTLDEPIFEPSMINQMKIDIGEERCKKMSLIALNEIDKRLLNIESVLPEQDILNIKRQAHTIKSTAASFGLMALSNVAKEMEQCCDDRLQHDELGSLTLELRNVFNLSKPYFDSM